MVGCGITAHLTRNQNITQTEILLSSNNYRIVKTVEGQAEATYICGIGGLSPLALKNNAYADMVKKAKLTGSQAIINVNTSEKRQAVLIYLHRTVMTSGTVIEFIDPAPTAAPQISKEPEIRYTTTDGRPLEIDTQKYPGLSDKGIEGGQRVIAVTNGYIPAGAFSNCDRLLHVTISNNILMIGPDAFNGCNKLQRIICQSEMPPVLGVGAFDGIASTAYIQVPQGTKKAYATNVGWGEYATIIEDM